MALAKSHERCIRRHRKCLLSVGVVIFCVQVLIVCVVFSIDSDVPNNSQEPHDLSGKGRINVEASSTGHRLTFRFLHTKFTYLINLNAFNTYFQVHRNSLLCPFGISSSVAKFLSLQRHVCFNRELTPNCLCWNCETYLNVLVFKAALNFFSVCPFMIWSFITKLAFALPSHLDVKLIAYNLKIVAVM